MTFIARKKNRVVQYIAYMKIKIMAEGFKGDANILHTVSKRIKKTEKELISTTMVISFQDPTALFSWKSDFLTM